MFKFGVKSIKINMLPYLDYIFETLLMVNLGQKTAVFGCWYLAQKKKYHPNRWKNLDTKKVSEKKMFHIVDTEMVSREYAKWWFYPVNCDEITSFSVLINH